MKLTDSERKARYAPLDLTPEQANELCEYDKACEKSDPSPSSKNFIPLPYDLTEAQRKTAKKMTSTGTRVYKFTNREKKEDATKASIVEAVARFLNVTYGVDPCIENPERKFSFALDGETYEVTLARKRKPK